MIPFHKPIALTQQDKRFLTCKVQDVILSGQVSNGEWVQILENRIKTLYKVDHVIATHNCTLGLGIVMDYFDLHTVLMPNFTWISPYLMFYRTKDVDWQDIDPETWLMDTTYLNKYERHVIKFPTHTFGNVIELEDDYHTIYDGAHSLGAKLTKFGEATVLSMAPSKIITSFEGGLVLTNNPHLADFVRYRRDKCARMTEIQAIMGMITIGYLDIVMQWKKKVYQYYKKHIPGIFQKIEKTSNYNTIGFINEAGLEIPAEIETRQYYEPIFDLEIMPKAYKIWRNIVCLPSYYKCPYEHITELILEASKL